VRTRIALLNLSHVLRNYEKVKTFQEEMKKAVEPYSTREAVIKKQAEPLEKRRMQPGTTPQERDQIEKQLKDLQRQLEDLKTDFNKMIGTQNEKQLVQLYFEVRDVASKYAQAHNFDAVFHYNDAVDGTEYWSGPNIMDKLRARSMVPLYYPAGMEISQDIINTLNAAYRSNQTAPRAPAPAPAAPAPGATPAAPRP
jgi:hypothetical protein